MASNAAIFFFGDVDADNSKPYTLSYCKKKNQQSWFYQKSKFKILVKYSKNNRCVCSPGSGCSPAAAVMYCTVPSSLAGHRNMPFQMLGQRRPTVSRSPRASAFARRSTPDTTRDVPGVRFGRTGTLDEIDTAAID